MEAHKIRIRIGDIEFDSEGEREAVQQDAERFMEAVRPRLSAPATVADKLPASKKPARADADDVREEDDVDDEGEGSSLDDAADDGAGNGRAAVSPDDAQDADRFKPIFRVDRGVVSLTALPTGKNAESETALLLLFGHRLYRGADAVSGMALMSGLNITGFTVQRADRSLARYIGGDGAFVLRFGKKRGVKYRLNNRGLVAARQIASDLLKEVA